MLGELIDGITTIEQHALPAVDEGDFQFTARGRRGTRIVSEAAGLGVKRGDVDHVRAERALRTGNWCRTPSMVVDASARNWLVVFTFLPTLPLSFPRWVRGLKEYPFLALLRH